MTKTRDEIMTPFRILSDATLTHTSGAKIYLEQRKSKDVEGEANPGEAVDQLLNTLRDVEGWDVSRHFGNPEKRPDQEPEDQTPQQYHDRVAAIVETLETAGVQGASAVIGTPAGWLRVMEEAATGIAARMEAAPGGEVYIQQIKEKFGTLRFYVQAMDGEDQPDPFFSEDIQEIADWAEGVTEGRCAVTGKPGTTSNDGWVMTLCDEMIEKRKEDYRAFGALLVPPQPAVQDEAPEL